MCEFCWFLLHRYITVHGSKNVKFTNFYIFRQRSAIFRESTNTKDHQFNSPIQLLIALKTLKCAKCLKILMRLHSFLTSALDRGRWSSYHSGYFTLRERILGTNWRGVWVGPRRQTRRFGEEIHLLTLSGIALRCPGRLARSPATVRTNWATPVATMSVDRQIFALFKRF
jgi:hypothetical protein